MGDLDNKVRKCFNEYAVDKSLAYDLDLTKLPRYVAEYLIFEFLSENGDWQSKLRNFIEKYYREPEEKELVKHELVTKDFVQVIDELRVLVDVTTGTHVGVLQSLDLWTIVPVDIVEKNKNTLINGMWGLIMLTKLDGGQAVKIWDKEISVLVEDFKPFQSPRSDPDLIKEARGCFTLDEWTSVLITTIGLDPNVYSPRQRLLLLSRLVPLVEGNVNMMEFGPRQTGKTYLYRNVSNYTRIISGGTITPAVLFYNLRTRVAGELAVKDVVVFDEVSKVRFPNPDEMMGKLKDYMESGQYERGDKRVSSDSSLVFMGNVEVERDKSAEESYVPVEDLTYVLPEPMRDPAFIDRVHGVIPGWELPKIRISKVHLAKGYGIASDYFSEALHSMRKVSLASEVGKHVELSSEFKIRDEKAFKRIMSGLIKLLFPHEQFDNSELRQVVELALEYRQRVRDWLHKLSPGEFPLEKLSVKVKG
ncbi:MAG: BREX system Lon protease-like protein BrxL [Acidilobus sp.]|jgi:ATP-dependent Lon protease|nr:BREX system Lon protease-like protein BrxL [Acidilobus sp.]